MEKKLLYMLILVFGVLGVSAKEFAIPASANGAFADILAGTKLLRESGVTLRESSANIVELRFKLIEEVNGERKSFRTIKGDTFFFNEKNIFLVRKGVLLMNYSIEERTATTEVSKNSLAFGLPQKHNPTTTSIPRTQKKPSQGRISPQRSFMLLDSASQLHSFVDSSSAPISQIQLAPKYASLEDSLLALSESQKKDYVLSPEEIERLIEDFRKRDTLGFFPQKNYDAGDDPPHNNFFKELQQPETLDSIQTKEPH